MITLSKKIALGMLTIVCIEAEAMVFTSLAATIMGKQKKAIPENIASEKKSKNEQKSSLEALKSDCAQYSQGRRYQWMIDNHAPRYGNLHDTACKKLTEVLGDVKSYSQAQLDREQQYMYHAIKLAQVEAAIAEPSRFDFQAASYYDSKRVELYRLQALRKAEQEASKAGFESLIKPEPLAEKQRIETLKDMLKPTFMGIEDGVLIIDFKY